MRHKKNSQLAIRSSHSTDNTFRQHSKDQPVNTVRVYEMTTAYCRYTEHRKIPKVWGNIHTYTHTYIHTYIHIYIHTYIHGLCGKFPNVQNSPPLRQPSGPWQMLLSSNEFGEPSRENRIALSCLVIVLCFFM